MKQQPYLQFNLRTLFAVTAVSAGIATCCRLYIRHFDAEPSGAAWLFACLTFVTGMVLAALAFAWVAVCDNDYARLMARIGVHAMAVAFVPLGLLLYVIFALLDRLL